MTRCLVTGSTGYIGGRLVPRLLDAGFEVRALARNPGKLDTVPWRGRTEVTRGDLGDPASLTAAVEGVDVVYYLVHSMGFEKDFAAEERRAARNMATAARAAGVRRIIYLSGLHPESDSLSTHLASRTAVGETLIASGVETVVLQAGVVVGSGSASFEMIRHLTDRLPIMTTPRWVHNKIQPIAIRDVLQYLVAAASCRVPESRAWDIGGPDVLEYGDMMQIYAEVAGLHPRRILVLPVLTPRIAALWVGLVTPIPSGLARPLVESLHCDAVMRNHDIDTVVPPPPGGLTPYRQAVSLALARIARGDVDTTWDTGTAALLPTDPAWSGEVVYIDSWSRHIAADPEQVLTEAERGLPSHWHLAERQPGMCKFQSARRGPGDRWLEIRVAAEGRGSRFEQRVIFYPRGLLGRLYWFATRPFRVAARAVGVHHRWPRR